MKSLMEEASSISKAIEQGWTNAGKPKEFSIKVYEEAEKNFFGMTTKSAKIGIFFDEPKKAEGKPRRAKPAEPRKKAEPKKVKEPPKEEPREDLGPIWSDEMVAMVKEWVGDLLPLMGMDGATYTIEPQRFHLRITFSSSLLADKDKQKHLFAVMSGLLLTMLKRHHKRPLRGYKIVLTEES